MAKFNRQFFPFYVKELFIEPEMSNTIASNKFIDGSLGDPSLIDFVNKLKKYYCYYFYSFYSNS